jgi:hypothetical protein
LLWVANRWFSVRIDKIGAMLNLITTLSLVLILHFSGEIDRGFAGLAIAYSLNCLAVFELVT